MSDTDTEQSASGTFIVDRSVGQSSVPNYSDPGAPRMMDQSAARHNEEAGAQIITQRWNFMMTSMQFHQQLLRQGDEANTASFLQQIAAAEKILKDIRNAG